MNSNPKGRKTKERPVQTKEKKEKAPILAKSYGAPTSSKRKRCRGAEKVKSIIYRVVGRTRGFDFEDVGVTRVTPALSAYVEGPDGTARSVTKLVEYGEVTVLSFKFVGQWGSLISGAHSVKWLEFVDTGSM